MEDITTKMLETFLQTRSKDKSEFLQHLQTDLNKIETNHMSATEQLNKLQETSDNIKELSEKAEHTALIPLSKNIYFNARIIHTGEYYLDKVAFPESYSVLQTKDQTLKLLANKIQQQNDLIEKFDGMKEQLMQRMSLLKSGDISDISFNGNSEVDDNEIELLPNEIKSDKGIAVKVGGFYEILEFEET